MPWLLMNRYYGGVEVERYVCQTSRGGHIDFPPEHRDRIVCGATALFFSQLRHKRAQRNARVLETNLA